MFELTLLINKSNVKMNIENKQLLVVSIEDLRMILQETISQSQDTNQANQADDVLLTSKEVMERLSVSSVTLWRWRKNNYLCPIQIGKKNLFYKLSDIKQLEGKV